MLLQERECVYEEVEQVVATPRIKNGVCGSGDKMSSLFINGLRLPKSHKVFEVYGTQETFGNSLQETCCECLTDLDKEDQYIFNWLKNNLHNFGAYCYWRGQEDKYAFPIELLYALNDRVALFQSSFGHCKDFLIHDSRKYVLLDKCRIDVRKLETAYAKWYEVLFGKSDPIGTTANMAAILNRLSTYLFNLLRYEYVKDSHKLGVKIEEKHWSGSVEPFKM